jgi:hypothetical protein
VHGSDLAPIAIPPEAFEQDAGIARPKAAKAQEES